MAEQMARAKAAVKAAALKRKRTKALASKKTIGIDRRADGRKSSKAQLCIPSTAKANL